MRGEERGEERVLVDGVPPWLQSTIQEWVMDQLQDTVNRAGFTGAYREWSTDRLRILERTLQLPLRWHKGGETAGTSLLDHMAADGDLALEVVDYLLQQIDVNSERQTHTVIELFEALRQGGSAWTVSYLQTRERFGLAKAVDDTTTSAVAAASGVGRAGQHMAIAWEAAYGRDPDASKAYREAVRAVEAAARPVLAPNDTRATLGKMIGYLRDAPQKWTVALASEDPVPKLRAMLEMLWTGQLDRHGTDDESVPLEVSLEDATAAVLLAVTLVHWFGTGAVKLR